MPMHGGLTQASQADLVVPVRMMASTHRTVLLQRVARAGRAR